MAKRWWCVCHITGEHENAYIMDERACSTRPEEHRVRRTESGEGVTYTWYGSIEEAIRAVKEGGGMV